MKMFVTAGVLAGAIALSWSTAHAQGGAPGAVAPSDPTTTTPTKPASPDTNLIDRDTPSEAEPVEATPRRLAPMNQPVQPVPTPLRDPPVAERTAFRRIGAAVLIGGGFEDFTNLNLRSMTSVGGSWNVRAVGGTYQVIGLEASYIGAARSIDALGLGSGATLVSNGVEGAVRFNVPLIQGRSLVEPFGFIGLGWSRYRVTNTNTSSSDVADRDDVMTFPYGAGLEFAYRAFIADARFTYRYTYRNDLMRTSGGRLNNYGGAAQVGFTF